MEPWQAQATGNYREKQNRDAEAIVAYVRDEDRERRPTGPVTGLSCPFPRQRRRRVDKKALYHHTCIMTLADKVTASRLVFAPCFFGIYLFARAPWTVPALWALFFITEITDLIDGKIARSRKEVSDFGKLFDPLADTLTWITFFFCFVTDRILPALPFLIILYREFGILFLRNLMLRKGTAMGARRGGKIKAFAYMFTGIASLLVSSLGRLGIEVPFFGVLRAAALGFFVLSALISLVSFVDYVVVYKKTGDGEK
jgi:CDP-diacylglycerol--glycerol-3-phosphate 3-phosphatidyltransferase